MRRLALARLGRPGFALKFAAGALALAATAAIPSAAQARDGRAPAAAGGPDIEELFTEDEGKQTAPPVEVKPEPAPPSSSQPESRPAPGGKVNKLSDLSTLSPFSDIAVIQKRFLPKTKRFEGFAAGSFVLNDPFFTNLGLNGRLGYYFRERWGVEFVAMLLTTAQRDVTKGLETRGITTQSLVSPTTYFGLDAKWTPIYGKMTFFNERIVPFDLYFSLGLGATGTNQGSQAPTLHLGTGQIFAMSKSFALRWDLSWNGYATSSSADPGRGTSFYNNIFMTVGASFFFPEATYR